MEALLTIAVLAWMRKILKRRKARREEAEWVRRTLAPGAGLTHRS
jgi:hypothetical protein